MASKEKILESWIMCEHLSEGSINLKDKKIKAFSDLIDCNYYDLLKRTIDEEKLRIRSNKYTIGIRIYFDIFEFSEIADILRNEYDLAPTDEDIEMGNKFGLALCFDEKLQFNKDQTFLTESAYIKKEKCVPDEKIFREYEESLKLEFEQLFDFSEIPEEEQKQYFNNAMLRIMEKIGVTPEKCRIQFLKNLEDEASSLHSFFIDDLKKAKDIDTPNLQAYLHGYNGNRYDLDSKQGSDNFNPTLFEKILRPINYPLGRFPSKTQFALSFMQQVAVNLATGYDNRHIRSVNGPPGTGKTTLLKDIFAELIVKQAYDLSRLPDHTLRGVEATKYYKNYSIGELPDYISENSIVVASSNNGAVKNIVDELPKISDIDEELKQEIIDADYFYDLSNCKFSSKWIKNDKGKNELHFFADPVEPCENWGLFSLEGGRAENVTNIQAALDKIFEYLNKEYESDPTIYSKFLNAYQQVEDIREQAEEFARKCSSVITYQNDYSQKNSIYLNERKNRELHDQNTINELKQQIKEYSDTESVLKTQLSGLANRRNENKCNTEQYTTVINTLKGQRPGLFAGRKRKNEFNDLFNDANQKLLTSIEDNKLLAEQEQELQMQLNSIQKKLIDAKKALDSASAETNIWISKKEGELSRLNSTIERTKQEISAYQGATLNMALDYDELQKSSPWFTQKYRKAQSRLFITALRARKEFLYENRDNIRAAYKIWGYQKKYQENKRLLKAAWEWINFTIPVISSTFASFGRMFKNLDENSLGHLFVDEAGQALPYAAVGAVFRSRHVMMVGDPSQIKPVATLDSNIMGLLCKHFDVDEKYISNDASAQTLADAASQYGFYFDKDRSESSWIGIPLWVHRRCNYPMFTIANHISYHNMMVQGEDKYGKTGWFDIKGNANNKYVREQGDFLAEKLLEMIKEDPEINDKAKDDIVYIITPFKHVAKMLAQRLDKIGFTRYEKDKPSNIGTIHTFQGKEAPIVFMVLGADNKHKGSARWSVSEPNMMNVAATRAKKEFYIIGDKALYQSLNSEVADDTIAIIERYKRKHPELIDEETVINDISSGFKDIADSSNNVETTVSQPENTPTNSIIGKITLVRMGHKNYYAYIKGSDGKKYTVNEKMYSEMTNADDIIIEGNMISFTPLSSNNTLYATNIKNCEMTQ